MPQLQRLFTTRRDGHVTAPRRPVRTQDIIGGFLDFPNDHGVDGGDRITTLPIPEVPDRRPLPPGVPVGPGVGVGVGDRYLDGDDGWYRTGDDGYVVVPPVMGPRIPPPPAERPEPPARPAVPEEEKNVYSSSRTGFRAGGRAGGFARAVSEARVARFHDSLSAVACVFAPQRAPPARMPDADGAQPTKLVYNVYYRAPTICTDASAGKYCCASLNPSPSAQFQEVFAAAVGTGQFLTITTLASPLVASGPLSAANALSVRNVATYLEWEPDGSYQTTAGTVAWLDGDSGLDTVTTNGRITSWSRFDQAGQYGNSSSATAVLRKGREGFPLIPTDVGTTGAIPAHGWVPSTSTVSDLRGTVSCLVRSGDATNPVGRWRVIEVWEVIPTTAGVADDVAETAATSDEFLLLREALEHIAPTGLSTLQAAAAAGLEVSKSARRTAPRGRRPRRNRTQDVGQRRMLLMHQSAVAAGRPSPFFSAFETVAASETLDEGEPAPVLGSELFDELLAAAAARFAPQEETLFADLEMFLIDYLETYGTRRPRASAAEVSQVAAARVAAMRTTATSRPATPESPASTPP